MLEDLARSAVKSRLEFTAHLLENLEVLNLLKFDLLQLFPLIGVVRIYVSTSASSARQS